MYWSPIELVSKKTREKGNIRVNFASGAPDPQLIPLNDIKQAILEVIEDPETLGYPGTGGLRKLRLELKKLLSSLGVDVSNRELVVTSGAQNAIHIVADLFLNEEDYFIVENPTFIEAFIALNHYTSKYRTIQVKLDGARTKPSGKELEEVKLIYVMPEVHNPTGTSMDEDYRREIVEQAMEHNIIVLEDDPYRPLIPSPKQPIANSDRQGLVFYVTSLSKIIAPGIRIGILLAPRDYAEKIEQAQQLDFSLNTLSMHIALKLLEENIVEKTIARARREYMNRMKTLLDLLEDHMPGNVEWSKPRGGFYVFIKTPADMDKLLSKALSMRVAYVPGKHFYVKDKENYKGTARLSISRVKEEDIEYGVKTLAKLIKEYS